jgi:hypothetical protein
MLRAATIDVVNREKLKVRFTTTRTGMGVIAVMKNYLQLHRPSVSSSSLLAGRAMPVIPVALYSLQAVGFGLLRVCLKLGLKFNVGALSVLSYVFGVGCAPLLFPCPHPITISYAKPAGFLSSAFQADAAALFRVALSRHPERGKGLSVSAGAAFSVYPCEMLWNGEGGINVSRGHNLTLLGRVKLWLGSALGRNPFVEPFSILPSFILSEAY